MFLSHFDVFISNEIQLFLKCSVLVMNFTVTQNKSMKRSM